MSENSRKAYEAVQELICKVDRQLHVSDDALNLSSANYQMKIRGSCLLTLHTTLFFFSSPFFIVLSGDISKSSSSKVTVLPSGVLQGIWVSIVMEIKGVTFRPIKLCPWLCFAP